MFSHNLNIDTYNAALKLNRLRAKLFLDRGMTVFPRTPGEISQFLKDGYFIQVSPVTTHRGDTAFKFEVVYTCENGCCYSYCVEVLDGYSKHLYKNKTDIDTFIPQGWVGWNYYTCGERSYIDALFEKEQEETINTLAHDAIRNIPAEELIKQMVDLMDISDMRVSKQFDFQQFMNMMNDNN